MLHKDIFLPIGWYFNLLDRRFVYFINLFPRIQKAKVQVGCECLKF